MSFLVLLLFVDFKRGGSTLVTRHSPLITHHRFMSDRWQEVTRIWDAALEGGLWHEVPR